MDVQCVNDGSCQETDLREKLEQELAEVSRRLGLEQILTLSKAIEILRNVDNDAVIAVSTYFLIPVAIAESMRERISALEACLVPPRSRYAHVLSHMRVPSIDDLDTMMNAEKRRLQEVMDPRYRQPNNTDIPMRFFDCRSEKKTTGHREAPKQNPVVLRVPKPSIPSEKEKDRVPKTSDDTETNPLKVFQPELRRRSTDLKPKNPIARKAVAQIQGVNPEPEAPRDPSTIESMLASHYRNWEPRQKYAFLAIVHCGQEMHLVKALGRICKYFSVDPYKYHFWKKREEKIVAELQESDKFRQESARSFVANFSNEREEFAWPELPPYKKGAWDPDIIAIFLIAFKERDKQSHYGALADAIRRYSVPEETIRFWLEKNGQEAFREAM